MSPRDSQERARVYRFPRVSGDEPGAVIARLTIAQFSPRERG